MIRVARHEITFLGSDLCRPECVVGELDGTLWVSDARGGITRLSCDGTAARLGRVPGTPNGIAIDRDNRFLVTDIDNGVLYRIDVPTPSSSWTDLRKASRSQFCLR